MRHLLFIALAVLSASAAAEDLQCTEGVLAAMHNRYARTWYSTLSFTQESITHKADGSRSSEIWHEALALPGRLRIDFGDPQAGNGALFVNDHQYVYKGGKLASDKPRVHPLLVLGFVIYRQPVAKTIQQLKDLHIDLSTIHEEVWKGRPMIVIGAVPGNLRSPQFWIDKERLYFVRWLQPDEQDPKATEEIDFDDYRQVEGGWLAQHVTVFSDDRLVFEEKYSDVWLNPAVDDHRFDPASFTSSSPTKP
jgi:hypothetical protein